MVDVNTADFNGLVNKISGFHWANSTISVNIDGLLGNMSQYNAALEALKMWTAFTGLKFNFVHDNGAQINLTNRYGGAFTTFAYDNGGNVTKSLVNVAPNWVSNWQTGGYGLQTFVHEIGHAIGLEHGGEYNGGTPSYDRDALFASDTWQYSVMSYFMQDNHPTNYATDLYLIGPMIADIEAIRKLYGPLAVNTGDTVYGAGETFLNGWTDFGKHANLAYCIHDTGGTDLIDYSNVADGRYLGYFGFGNVIDLRPGAFSDIGGHIGNVSIALDTVIENVRGSQLLDIIHGNGANNMISGLDGNDYLYGGDGKDSVDGGLGDDYMEGNDGNDQLDGGDGYDTLYGGDGDDVMKGGSGDDYMEGGSGSDDYYVDSSGDQVIEYGYERLGNEDVVKKPTDWVAYNKVKAPTDGDHVFAAVSHMLADNVECLDLTGKDNINGTGNGLNNWIKGNGGDNVLKGMDGSDKIWAGGGADTLDGGSGDDWLDGGYAHDVLTGGTGNDAFSFGAGFSKGANGLVGWGSLNASSDIVRDFVHAEDIIVLSRTSFAALNSGDMLDKASFLLLNKGTLSAATRVIYDQSCGKLFYDADGSGKGYDKVLIAAFENKAAIDASDFMLVA